MDASRAGANIEATAALDAEHPYRWGKGQPLLLLVVGEGVIAAAGGGGVRGRHG